MPHRRSSVARAARRARGAQRGYVTAVRPGMRHIEVPLQLRARAKAVVASLAVHEQRAALTGRRAHYAKNATLAARDQLSEAEFREDMATHRRGNRAKHAEHFGPKHVRFGHTEVVDFAVTKPEGYDFEAYKVRLDACERTLGGLLGNVGAIQNYQTEFWNNTNEVVSQVTKETASLLEELVNRVAGRALVPIMNDIDKLYAQLRRQHTAAGHASYRATAAGDVVHSNPAGSVYDSESGDESDYERHSISSSTHRLLSEVQQARGVANGVAMQQGTGVSAESECEVDDHTYDSETGDESGYECQSTSSSAHRLLSEVQQARSEANGAALQQGTGVSEEIACEADDHTVREAIRSVLPALDLRSASFSVVLGAVGEQLGCTEGSIKGREGIMMMMREEAALHRANALPPTPCFHARSADGAGAQARLRSPPPPPQGHDSSDSDSDN